MIDPNHAPEPALAAAIPGEVLEHDCGCGSAWRWAREGEAAIDLGCGAGKTCFLLSRAVGRSGSVIGVDASAAMLAVARRHQADVARAIGWANVRFVEARIQDPGRPGGAPVADASADLAVIDCVLTLVQARERPAILAAALRVLRPGGRAFVSDVLAEDLEGIPEAMAAAGFERIDVVERLGDVVRVVDGVERRATTLRGFRRGGERP